MSIKLFSDLFVLLLVLVSTAIILLGWGNLTWRWLGIKQPSQPSVTTVWLGFCIMVACLEIVHLFVPIDWQVTLASGVIGVLGQLLRVKTVSSTESRHPTTVEPVVGLHTLVFDSIKRYPFLTLGGLLIVVSWCLLAMQAPSMFDSGLYHFGSIRWLNEYAIVPGLGNLHWRLALNQSYFGFLALLNIAPYWGHGYAAGGLFLLVLTAFTVLEVLIKQSTLWRWVFGGLLFSYLCLLSGPISNPMPDTAMALVQIVIFIFLYCSFVAQTTTQAQTTSAASISLQRLQIVLVFLCFTIVTIKLSSLVFATVSFAIVMISIFRATLSQFPYKVFLKIGILFVIFILVHIGRGYLLSGAPFFPSPIGGLWSLPWAVPFGVANNESQLIYAWAKQPGVSLVSDVPAGYGWVRTWISGLPLTHKCLFVMSSISLFCAIIAGRRCANAELNKTFPLGILMACALVFWFFTAPDPRFLGAIIVLYFTWSLFVFLDVVRGRIHWCASAPYPNWENVLHSLVIVGVGVLFLRWSILGMSTPVGWHPLPESPSAVQFNRSGYKALVPMTGMQCWDADLPCTSMLDDGLQQKLIFKGTWLPDQQSKRFSLSIEK